MVQAFCWSGIMTYNKKKKLAYVGNPFFPLCLNPKSAFKYMVLKRQQHLFARGWNEEFNSGVAAAAYPTHTHFEHKLHTHCMHINSTTKKW